MGKSRYGNWVLGRWLIESMDQWDRSFIDEDARGYCELDASSSGSFAFGHVQGQIDYRMGERDGRPTVEFSWNGCDEMTPAQGRGWLLLEGDPLKGMFFIHCGEESGIVLRREPEKKQPASRKRK